MSVAAGDCQQARRLPGLKDARLKPGVGHGHRRSGWHCDRDGADQVEETPREGIVGGRAAGNAGAAGVVPEEG